MNNDSNNLTELSKFVSRSLELSDSESLNPTADFNTLEEFKIYLAKKLKFLLENKYDALINLLYRIDVQEDRLSELFAGQNKHSIPTSLAELIIERSLQKIRFRQKHKNGEI